MLTIIATAALPVLALTLTLGGVAKLATAGREASPGALTRLGPVALAPERFARPAMIACALTEFALAGGSLVLDHPVTRWSPVVFFAIATYVLWDLRRRRPDVGCGCFGEVSAAPVGLRSIGRAAALTAMAVLVAAGNVPGLPGVMARPVLPRGTAAWIAGGLVLLLLVLSPEIDEVAARVRHRAPCEQRALPSGRALSRLRGSAAWRAHAGSLVTDEPSDMWRELCWRFFVFPARDGAEVVFAVYLSGRRPAVRVAVVGADGRVAAAAGDRTDASLRESTPVSA
ncbi:MULTISPECIES: MauE/DoxX family redox-associated membrane protein [unclassified Microbispora]|uniref:MauE/DoxX family redox-associated membrane protein n=1 Tax=unclassified Microbispora TaxID=2614687 RepID=UPI0016019584|nr:MULTISPECIES: MauE/DoxX family redox-associated membrane protein [unclassified Microbispora]